MTMPASRRTPGYRIDYSFAGLTNIGTKADKVYLLGEILAAGTMSEGDIVGPISNHEEARTAAGAGSILAHMAAGALRQRPGGDTVPIYLVGLAEATGNQAAQTFTFANNAGEDSTLVIDIAGQWVTVTIDAGNTPTLSGDALVAAFNALDALLKPPCTVANVAGVVTATATNKGTIGNDITTRVVSFNDSTQTCTAGAATMAGGTGSVTLTTALAAIQSVETHFLAVSPIDATALESIRAHMETKGNSTNQMGGVWVAGNRDTASNVTTLADTIHGNGDAIRGAVVAAEDEYAFSPYSAAQGAVSAASESDCARPHNGLPLSSLEAPPDSKRWTITECETLLDHGVTPLRTSAAGSSVVKLVRLVSIRQDVQDPLDLTKIRTLDEIRRRIIANFEANLDRAKLKKDGEQIYTSDCVTPSSVMGLAKAVLLQMETEDKVQGIRTGLYDDGFKAVKGTGGQVQLTIPADVVDGLHDVVGELIMQLS